MPDIKTTEFYEENAEKLFEQYNSAESPIRSLAHACFRKKTSILDVGCGSGRDLRVLLQLGYDAEGIEPSETMRNLTTRTFPELEERILPGQLPNLDLKKRYDGILCSAVLMHLPTEEHLSALASLKDQLNHNGRLVISIPLERSDLDNTNRDIKGRLFEPIYAEKLILLCSRLGLQFLSRFDSSDSLGRSNIKWTTLLFEKHSAIGRPLDLIESVLRNDKKVATYKLALMRAFCDLADADENNVTWLSNGEVAMEIRKLSECWLKYYWPIIASPADEWIPQSTGELGDRKRPLSFRSDLTNLVIQSKEYFQLDSNALFSIFMFERKKGRLPSQIKSQTEKVLKKIDRAIIEGPVKHSASGTLFSYNKSTKKVHLDTSLWHEFCLTGYWIRDSLILRWAELTVSFARNTDTGISIGSMMTLLLMQEEVAREQQYARKIYNQHPNLHCIWSGKPLKNGKFDVDHGIPFSVSRNNDLWNLLPADPKVNNQKRDLIPSPIFIRECQERLVNNWEILRSLENDVFTYELKKTIGTDVNNWQKGLFAHFCGKAEQLIFSRGLRSWSYNK